MSVGSGDYIKRPDENEPTVDKDEQELYRSGVGMLIWLNSQDLKESFVKSWMELLQRI